MQTAVVDRHLPAFGQLWALGFMAAVNAWPAEWVDPRNTGAAYRWTCCRRSRWMTPTQQRFRPSKTPKVPPTVSGRRMKAFGDAIWAVYNMRDTWRQLGPRVETPACDSNAGAQ